MIPLGILASSIRKALQPLIPPANLRAEIASYDLYWDKVVALLHFDGDFTDVTGRVWVNHDSNLTFGVAPDDTSCLRIEQPFGVSAGLSCDESSDFNFTSDFTIECTVWSDSTGQNLDITSNTLNYWHNPGVTWRVEGGKERFVTHGPPVAITSSQIPTEGWVHLALVRVSNDILIFRDGVKVLEWPDYYAGQVRFDYGGTRLFSAMGYSQTGAFNGYVKEYRATKGIARYTENFTPPTEPFPNFGPPKPVDPYWDNVVALLHFDGDLVDEADLDRAWGGSYVASPQSGVGGSTALDKTARISVPDSGNDLPTPWVFYGEPCTLEFFLRRDSSSDAGNIISLWPSNIRFKCEVSNSNLVFTAFIGSVRTMSFGLPFIDSNLEHIAIVRGENGIFSAFRQGVKLSQTYGPYSGATHLGTGGNVTAGGVTFDELRITKGVARYTEDFTPPTKPFPNSGPEPTPNPLPTVIGEPYGGGFYAGDIESDGQWFKLIVADVSADITGANASWKTTSTDTPNTDHLTDGVANTAAMIAAGISLHPAANHCVNYDGGGYTDWYMPAKDELNVIYLNLGYNRPDCPPDFLSSGPQAFSDEWYWASTQYWIADGWVRHFSNGTENYYNKTYTSRRVRPVRRLQFNP